MDDVLIEVERRQGVRVDFSKRLFFQVAVPTNHWLPPNDGDFQGREQPSGQIQNVGNQGCCLIIDRPLEKFLIIKLAFPLSRESVSVPTLAEVRWVRPELEPDQYKVGVRYLL